LLCLGFATAIPRIPTDRSQSIEPET
jgi:hypothetical protein